VVTRGDAVITLWMTRSRVLPVLPVLPQGHEYDALHDALQ
jgi:hypothetical protein